MANQDVSYSGMAGMYLCCVFRLPVQSEGAAAGSIVVFAPSV